MLVWGFLVWCLHWVLVDFNYWNLISTNRSYILKLLFRGFLVWCLHWLVQVCTSEFTSNIGWFQLMIVTSTKRNFILKMLFLGSWFGVFIDSFLCVQVNLHSILVDSTNEKVAVGNVLGLFGLMCSFKNLFVSNGKPAMVQYVDETVDFVFWYWRLVLLDLDWHCWFDAFFDSF